MFKIEDNYLKEGDHLILKTIMESSEFPWFYNPYKNWKDKSNRKLFDYQLVHIFYKDHTTNSNFLNHLTPIIEKLKPLSLIKIKANLNPITHKLIEFDKHQDQSFKCKIAIYYLNDNDGYTIIGNKKIESKANRMVFFTSDKEHYGTNSTNCNNRMLINFNYF